MTGSGLQHVVIRLPEVYGLGGREGVDAIIDSARRDAPILIPGGGPHELSPLHADDVSAALAAALELPARERVHPLRRVGHRRGLRPPLRPGIRLAQPDRDHSRRGAQTGERSRSRRPPPALPGSARPAARAEGPVHAEAQRDLQARFRTLDEGLRIDPGRRRDDDGRRGRARAKRAPVAVCMATYEPAPELFERQLASLREQTHDNWVCVDLRRRVERRAFAVIEQAVAGDSRFEVSRSDERLGFYRNFERALEMAPAGAELVAFADQDDLWHPDKLETLAARDR